MIHLNVDDFIRNKCLKIIQFHHLSISFLEMSHDQVQRLEQQVNTLKEELKELRKKYRHLELEKVEIEEKYNSLNEDYEELKLARNKGRSLVSNREQPLVSNNHKLSVQQGMIKFLKILHNNVNVPHFRRIFARIKRQ
jgi:chromosome segregation ATPase